MKPSLQLQSLGYEVTSSVDTGDDAIKKAVEDKPDLILMDIRIAGELDGIDTAEVIRNRFGIPVIFSTAYLDQGRIQRAKITMPFGYVLKPIQERDLRVTLEMALYVSKVDGKRRKVKAEIAKSELRFRTMFEKSPYGVALVDTFTEDFYEVNQKFSDIIGLTKEEAVNTHWTHITHPDDIKEDQDNMNRLKNGDITGFNMQKRYIHKNGSYVWINMTIEQISISGKNGVHLCMIEDITERKQAEEALKESEERSNLLLKATTEGLCFHDQGLVLHSNERLVEIFGYDSLEEILELKINVIQFAAPESRELVRKNSTSRYEKPYEAMGLRKDGSTFPIMLHGRQIPFEGKTVRIASVIDLTEQRQAEESLKKSEKKYRKLFEGSIDGYALADPETGIILDCNLALADLVGRTKEELIGQHQRLLHPVVDPKADFSSTFEKHKTEKQGKRIEAQIITKNGELKDVVILSSVFEISGKEVVHGIFYDINV
jgi:PAS domain S-box-containing protein